MAQTPAEKVLACPTLPTLPGVALRVLELTGKPDVSINEIASTVQNDPALSTKVLRTVNSSFYALSSPCPSISRAMSLLGLNAVKAIVLGFSLVDFTKNLGDHAPDMSSFWRRAVYSAAGARAFAAKVKGVDPEEVFLGALVQDIGILACIAALKGDYARVLADAPPEHDALAAHERKVFQFDHAEIGRQLGERWKLPPALVECIAKHHQPDQADPRHQRLVRLVSLGAAAAAALTDADPRKSLGRLLINADRWFTIGRDDAKMLLGETAKGAKEIAKLLELSTGQPPDMGSILSQAHEQLIAAQEQVQQEAAQLRQSNTRLARQSVTDALTGANNRAAFDASGREMFAAAKGSGSSLAVIFIDADKFKSVNDAHGHQAGDAVLVELARRLMAGVGKGGMVCRYGGEEFAVLLPGSTAQKAAQIADLLRRGIERTPVSLIGTGAKTPEISITISAGVAALEPANAQKVENIEQVVNLADAGVYAAKQGGRNCVRVNDPLSPINPETPAKPGAQAAPAPAGPARPAPAPQRPERRLSILVIDDDPLASKLLVALLAKRGTIQPVIVRTAEEALGYLARRAPTDPLPDVVVCDVYLPGMSGTDLVRQLRARLGCRPPVIMISCDTDPATQLAARNAGADVFIEKGELCNNLDKWLDKLDELTARSKAA